MAARSYFGKSAKSLDPGGGRAAGRACQRARTITIPTGYPERAQERLAYVLGRMQEDGVDQRRRDEARDQRHCRASSPIERPRRDTGFHFVDQLAREARTFAGVDGLTAGSYTVRSTIDAGLAARDRDRAAGGLGALRDSTRAASQFQGPEANLAEAVRRDRDGPEGARSALPKPAWQQALESARLPLYDVHWPAAVVLERAGQGGGITVGLARRPRRCRSTLRGAMRAASSSTTWSVSS